MSDEKNFNDDINEAANEAREFGHEAEKTVSSTDNKKVIAGVLAILVGALGVHKFILGYNKEGIIMLVVTIVLGVLTCGIAAWALGIVGLIEGIIYLTKSDEEFYRTYQLGKKPWF
ncbi:MAG: TM2 domain-containing protein [Flavobacteriales bacterium]